MADEASDEACSVSLASIGCVEIAAPPDRGRRKEQSRSNVAVRAAASLKLPVASCLLMARWAPRPLLRWLGPAEMHGCTAHKQQQGAHS
jgi:hypothetical protein